MTEPDTLKNAALGDTVEYEYQTELYGPDMLPEELFRSDVEENITDAELEMRTDDYGNQHITVIVEGEAMKVLPRNWSYCKEPRTPEEEATQRKRKWLGRVIQGIGFALPFGVTLAVMSKVNEAFAGTTINGEPMQPASLGNVAISLFLLMLISAVIVYGIQGGFPRANGGRA
jgi:hypothetical protein